MRCIKFCIGLLIAVLFWNCQNNQDKNRYLITDNSIGGLTKSTTVAQIESTFEGDSVVNESNASQFSSRNEIIVYQKGNGREMLRLHPKESSDSTSTIASIQVRDTLYKTKKGLGLGTSFEDFSKHYKVKRIENTLGTAMIFFEDTNLYIDIDKSEIYEPTQMGVEIKTSQIKKRAKVKHLWIDWD